MMISENILISVVLMLLNQMLLMLFRNRMFMVMQMIMLKVFRLGFSSSSKFIRLMVVVIGKKFLISLCIIVCLCIVQLVVYSMMKSFISLEGCRLMIFSESQCLVLLMFLLMLGMSIINSSIRVIVNRQGVYFCQVFICMWKVSVFVMMESMMKIVWWIRKW